MIPPNTIDDARAYVESFFAADVSGHDAHHTFRVERAARTIAREEGADVGIVTLAALLHDIDDSKLSPETSADLGHARTFLEQHCVQTDDAEAVLTAIREVSFSRNGATPPSSLEAACVRDADRLDAIGAIGVARAFAFGGAHGRALYDPSGSDAETTIQHFRDKLLKLAGMMSTPTGKRLAQDRDRYLHSFLEEFQAEWEGTR